MNVFKLSQIFKKKLRILNSFLLFFLLSCSSRMVPDYSIAVYNALELKKNSNQSLNVDLAHSGKKIPEELQCRLESLVTSTDENFESYIKGAFITELTNANLYSQNSKNKIIINIEEINLKTAFFSEWEINLKITLNNHKTLVIKRKHNFEWSPFAEAACVNAKWEFMFAVQKLIYSIIANPDFKEFITKIEK